MMKKLRLGTLLVWLGLITVLHAENSLIPIEPISGSIAPYVDKDGYVNPIISLGSIDFGGGLTLPLVLNFSSAVRSPSPEFGQGWECPLFEAKVFDVQPNLKRLETLGGKDRYFIYDQRTDTWKHYFTYDWKVKADGDRFELTYKTGCKFIFDKGLISSLITPDGRTILWNRSGDKLVSLQELGKPLALQITYDKLGFAENILLNPDAAGVAKKSFSLHTDLAHACIDKIEGQGRTIAFDRTRDKQLNPILSWRDTMQLPETLSWDLKTGKILSDNRYDYQITEVEAGNVWPKMARKDKTLGALESYYFDEKHGTTDETLSDGTVRHTEMVQAPGPNYKDIRLVQETKNGKTQILLRRAFDDQGHLIQEDMAVGIGQMQVKQYAYDSAGRIISYYWNGKEMWKNTYDDVTGELKERELPELGMKLAFEPLTDGQVKETIAKGTDSVTKTLAPTDWNSTVDAAQRIQ